MWPWRVKMPTQNLLRLLLLLILIPKNTIKAGGSTATKMWTGWVGEWVIPLRLLRLPEHLAVLQNAFTRQCQNGRRSSWEVRPYTWRKTLFVIWDVNRFADKSSCATDPICKMLHLMGQLLHFHLRPSLPGQILSKRYFIFVPILIIILPIVWMTMQLKILFTTNDNYLFTLQINFKPKMTLNHD